MASRPAGTGLGSGAARLILHAAEEAEEAAEKALSDESSVDLPAMNAAERRIVHQHLRDREDVDTHSEGDEPRRYLVITPVIS